MTEVLLFHHAQGQTAGFLEFASKLTAGGNVVHMPDLYDGHTFESLDDGVAYAEGVGFDEIIRLGMHASESLPADLVYMGFSLGTLPAQALAQTRPGARGAVLLHGGIPTEAFEAPWPAEVPLQMHTMDADEWVEIEELQELVRQIPDAELFLYPGHGHLFADSSLRDFDEAATKLLVQRTLTFLERCS